MATRDNMLELFNEGASAVVGAFDPALVSVQSNGTAFLYFHGRYDQVYGAGEHYMTLMCTHPSGYITFNFNSHLADSTSGPHYSAWVTLDPVAPVPEPTTMLLLGTGLIGLAGFRKKFKG